MTRSSEQRSGLPDVEYYAPSYVVRVEGEELDPESKGDVLELRVSLGIEELASFEMTVNNWDDRHLTFKYSDSPVFDMGRRVEVMLGYADRVTTVFQGQITRLVPKFPDSGSPTLTITALDGLVRLRDRQPEENESRRYEDVYDWQIAQQVAERHGLAFHGDQEGPWHRLVWQKNQDDASFLMERASRIDFDCYIDVDPDTGESTLYFVNPTDGRRGGATRVYTLEWQKSLSSFMPQIDVGQQVSSVTVRGWNPETKEAIVYTATADDVEGAGDDSSGPQVAEDSFGGKSEQVVDAPVMSQAEAEALATALLNDRAYRYVTGDGEIIGLPDLRPGHNLELAGLGERFSGAYYVTSVEHNLGPSGFRTKFHVRRNATPRPSGSGASA